MSQVHLLKLCLDPCDNFLFCERLFEVHRVDTEVLGTIVLPDKDNAFAIRGKNWIRIDDIIVGELSLIFAVCVHQDNFRITVPIGIKENLRAIGRKGRMCVNRYIIGQFCETVSIAINDANLAGHADGTPYSIGGGKRYALRRARTRVRDYWSEFGLIASGSSRLRP